MATGESMQTSKDEEDPLEAIASLLDQDNSADHRVKNWLTAMFCIQSTKKGLEHFVETTSVEVKNDVDGYLSSAIQCTECTSQDITSRNATCTNCKPLKTKLKLLCRNGTPTWRNTTLSEMNSSHHHIAKLFMPPMCRNYTKPEEGDSTALLSFIADCIHARVKLQNPAAIDKVRKCRNDIIHSGTWRIEDGVLEESKNTCIELLMDRLCLKDDIHCQQAIESIKKVTELRDPKQYMMPVMENMLKRLDKIEANQQAANKNEHITAKDITEITPKRIKCDSGNPSLPETSPPPHDLRHQVGSEDTFYELESSTFDGRLIHIETGKMERLMDKAIKINEGAFGQTYTCQVKISGKDKTMLVKRIQCKEDIDNRQSAIREMLASRLKHHYIVPLLAFSENKKEEIFYFMMPYFENGDLHNAIVEDTRRIKNNETSKLTREVRMRVMSQLATVLEFLHKPVDKVRNEYVHGDISSRNIVLDEEWNIRLLDFGLSKEIKGSKYGTTDKSSNRGGTNGYVPENCPVKPQRDCYSWAAITLELLTGHPAVRTHGIKLMDENIKERHKKSITSFWKETGYEEDGKVNSILNLVDRCKRFEVTANEIVKRFTNLLPDDGFKAYKKPGNSKCNICMVTEKMEADILNHNCGNDAVDVCVACLRKSFINPIKCPYCHQDLISPIGDKWGAVLIAGNDEDDVNLATTFKNDVDTVYKTITSKRRLAMGIRETRVKKVCLKRPGTKGTLTRDLETAFDSFLQEENMDTLLLYITGHIDKKGQFILGQQSETLSKEKLYEMLQELRCRIKRLIVFLDYCNPTDSFVEFSEESTKLAVLTIKACGPQEKAMACDKGSCFTNLFVQCMSGRAGGACSNKGTDGSECDVCKDKNLAMKLGDGFLSLEYMTEFIGRHIPDKDVNSSNKKANWRDVKIAYYIPECADLRFEFDCIDPLFLDHLPETMDELKQTLQNFLIEHLVDGAVRCKNFLDVYAVVVKTGAGANPYYELTTLESIEAAWNGHSALHVLPRNIRNINNGKVGFFLEENKIKPDIILTIVSNNKEKITIDKEVTVQIPLEQLEELHEVDDEDLYDCQEYLLNEIDYIVNVYRTGEQREFQDIVSDWECRASQKCPNHKKLMEYFCENDKTDKCSACNKCDEQKGHRDTTIKEKIQYYQQLAKKKTGDLVFTFPLDEKGEHEKFFSVHIPKQNESGELIGQA